VEGVQSGQLQAQKGLGKPGRQAHRSVALFPSVFSSRGGGFSTFHHIKQTGSQRPASKSVERLLMTCLGSRAFSAKYGFNLTPAFAFRERTHLTGSAAFSCPGCMPHLPSCVLQCPLELFPVEDEFQLKQMSA